MSFSRVLGERLREGLRRSQELLADGLDDRARARPARRRGAARGARGAADRRRPRRRARGRLRQPRARGGRCSGTRHPRRPAPRRCFRRFLEETLAPAAAPLDLDAPPGRHPHARRQRRGQDHDRAPSSPPPLKATGKRVLLAAADTFRAAAIEQLEEWGGRIDVEVIRQAAGADPAAVVFDAVKAATARGIDVLIVDTAGRLHTKTNLMDELVKLKRVIERQLPGAPHESLMVLDAPTGQNGFAQARMFHEAVGLTGLVPDQARRHRQGRHRGPHRARARLPIKLIGVGEQIEDLQPFDPAALRGRAGGRPSDATISALHAARARARRAGPWPHLAEPDGRRASWSRGGARRGRGRPRAGGRAARRGRGAAPRRARARAAPRST